MRVCAALFLTTIAAIAPAATTVDGVLTAGETYLAASNAASGIDTNVAHYSAGNSAKSERLAVAFESTRLNVFVEGDLNNTNGLFVLIDSDNSSATGFSGPHPNGASTQSNALEYFLDFPAGGYDLGLAIQGGSSGAPTNFGSVYVFSYTSAGALLDETLVSGGTVGLVESLPATIRGVASTLEIGEVPGDAANNGVELGIPRQWLLNPGTSGGAVQVIALNCNGTFNTWFNSTIPENSLPTGTDIGSTGDPTNNNVLTSLTAPDWNWITLPAELSVFSAE